MGGPGEAADDVAGGCVPVAADGRPGCFPNCCGECAGCCPEVEDTSAVYERDISRDCAEFDAGARGSRNEELFGDGYRERADVEDAVDVVELLVFLFDLFALQGAPAGCVERCWL